MNTNCISHKKITAIVYELFDAPRTFNNNIKVVNLN